MTRNHCETIPGDLQLNDSLANGVAHEIAEGIQVQPVFSAFPR
jgi:hypothetical protein